MDTIAAPSPYRLAQLATDAYELPLKVFTQGGGSSSPSLSHLCLLVFEAVLEVVCVSLPGYIIARLGQFDADKQKFLANLNVSLFTPCLTCSLYQARLSAERREAERSRHHPRHLRCSDPRLLDRRCRCR